MKNKFEHGDRVDYLKDDNFLNGAVMDCYTNTYDGKSFVYNVRFANYDENENERPFVYKLCREHELIKKD